MQISWNKPLTSVFLCQHLSLDLWSVVWSSCVEINEGFHSYKTSSVTRSHVLNNLITWQIESLWSFQLWFSSSPWSEKVDQTSTALFKVTFMALYCKLGDLIIITLFFSVFTSGAQCSGDVHYHQWGRWQFSDWPRIRGSDRHQEAGPWTPIKVFPSGAGGRWKTVIWHEAEHNREGRQWPHAQVLPSNILVWYPRGHGARYSLTGSRHGVKEQIQTANVLSPEVRQLC